MAREVVAKAEEQQVQQRQRLKIAEEMVAALATMAGLSP
jgi:hypothetical protein